MRMPESGCPGMYRARFSSKHRTCEECRTGSPSKRKAVHGAVCKRCQRPPRRSWAPCSHTASRVREPSASSRRREGAPQALSPPRLWLSGLLPRLRLPGSQIESGLGFGTPLLCLFAFAFKALREHTESEASTCFASFWDPCCGRTTRSQELRSHLRRSSRYKRLVASPPFRFGQRSLPDEAPKRTACRIAVGWGGGGQLAGRGTGMWIHSAEHSALQAEL